MKSLFKGQSVLVTFPDGSNQVGIVLDSCLSYRFSKRKVYSVCMESGKVYDDITYGTACSSFNISPKLNKIFLKQQNTTNLNGSNC